VATDGRIDWMPTPALHTPPVFAALLDSARGGYIALTPVGEFTSTRRYVDGTNVLRTEFRTATGVAVVTDALVTGVAGRLPWCELARRIEGVQGTVDFEWAVVPGNIFDSGTVTRRDTVHGPILRAEPIGLALVGFEHGRTDPHEPGQGFSDAAPEFRGAFTASAGSRHMLVLCGTDDEPLHLPDPRIVDEGIDRTIDNWQHWSTVFHYDGPWADAVHRSALALKLLIFSPTGAIAAAATTSLPENVNGGKNWDYRFAWVRDLAYTVGALARFGLREETHAAVSWILKTLKQDDELHILFRLDGSLPGDSRRIDADGWDGNRPVVTGNRASDQLQLGVFADLIGIMKLYVEAGNILDHHTSELLVQFANETCRSWQQEDAGMWELEENRHYTSSKMGCWQALDDACTLASLGEVAPSAEDLEYWKRNRTLIEEWLATEGWSEQRGAYVMYPGSDALDASVLLHAGDEFGPAERMRRTIERIQEELAIGELVYRYTGMASEEGTFTACGFWLIDALAKIGRVDDASRLMDALVARANDVGLYSEMIAEDGAFLGNLPQGLSHLALVNAAIAIGEARG
jgi:GH15 family glucan-1,4-alpha-glucosidase